MELGLEGKTAVITGGANGIGAETARRFFEEGANVVIADLDAIQAKQTASDIGQSSGRVIGIETDVTNETSVQHLVARTIDIFSAVHVLVNNAGVIRNKSIQKMSEADWDLVLDVSLKGAFLCTRAVMPHFVAQGWGRLINLSSRAHLGNAGQANYSAAKAGLLGFTKAISLEHARHNITSNAVAPGIIDTKMARAVPHFDRIVETAMRNLPIPRLGTPDDVADAILFLASNRASYITGEIIHVTGGRYG